MGLFKKSNKDEIPDIIALQAEAAGSSNTGSMLSKSGGCASCAGAAVSNALAAKRHAKKVQREAGA